MERHKNKSCTYNQNKFYVVFSALGSFFVPLVVMLYVYVKISRVIARRHSSLHALNQPAPKVTDNNAPTVLSSEASPLGRKPIAKFVVDEISAIDTAMNYDKVAPIEGEYRNVSNTSRSTWQSSFT